MKPGNITLITLLSVGIAASAALAQSYGYHWSSRWTNPSSSDVVSPPTSRPMGSMGMGSMGMMGSMHVSSEFDYLRQMIPHHQEAIETAQLVLERSQRAEMREFAQNIIDVQSREIEQMQTWLREWYPNQDTTVTYQPMMRDLSQLNASALDRAFLEDMIMHHMGAVMMSHQLTHRGLVEHEAVRPFAEQIASSQLAEIGQMQAWLTDWYGTRGMTRRGMHRWMMEQWQ